MVLKKVYFVVFFLLIIFNSSVHAQKYMHDSTYYKTFLNTLTVRVYAIKDYSDFNLKALSGNSDLKYRSNTNVNLGIGATYDNVSLNLSTNIGFINKGNDDKGKTKALDIQLYFLPRKWVADFVYQHYKGYYVTPKDYTSSVPNSFYYRPDVKTDLLGFAAYRNFNYKRFSMRSGFNQNEWIKKSAGSFLLGGDIYYQNNRASDSSLIPAKVAQYFSNSTFKKFHFLSFGLGAGYGYTLAFAKHFFIMGSAIVNANINLATDGDGAISNKKTSFEPALIYKAAIGYNGNVWNITADWSGKGLYVKQAGVSKTNTFPSGFVRFMVARQIQLKKPFRLADNIIHGIFGNTD